MAELKKYYPISGRKDFFKWTIIKTGESVWDDNAELHRDFKGEEMYFQSKVDAQHVCDAINRVERKRKNWFFGIFSKN